MRGRKSGRDRVEAIEIDSERQGGVICGMVWYDIKKPGYYISAERIPYNTKIGSMITNKLVKQAKKEDVLVELSSKEELPDAVSDFMKACRTESIMIKRAAIPSYQVSFYYVNGKKGAMFEGVEMKEVATELEHAMTIIYMNHQNEQKISLPERPGVRTLLVREDLDTKYWLEYEVENTCSKKESTAFFCDLCASFLNRACSKELEFFDQKVEEIIRVRKNEPNVLRDTWVNILYQIPGLGKDKSLKIAEKFPTYQSILRDYEGAQELKDTLVGKSKLGKSLATRIYKVFLGTKYQESVID